MTDISVAAIAAEAGVTEQQVHTIVTSALRSIHRVGVAHERGLTAALMRGTFAFGGEAGFHIYGLLSLARQKALADDTPWSETVMRFAPSVLVYQSVAEKWAAHREPPA